MRVGVLSWMLAMVIMAVLQGDRASAQSEPRLALLIGNEAYPSDPGRLRRPHGDVRDLQRALEDADFAVTRVLDADAAAIEGAVVAFADALEDAGPTAVGFFYYAGHGAVAVSEARRRNFMLPARTSIANAREVALRGVRLDRVVDVLENAGAGALFVVYDACRNSFSRGGRGFEVVPERPGLLLALSTMADATTPDDGAYAIALAEEIRRPGQPAELAFINATQAVAQTRPRDQLPVLRPALVEPFCFQDCGAPQTPAADLSAYEARIAELERALAARPEAAIANEPSGPRPGALTPAARYGASPLDGKPVVDGALVTDSTPAGTVFKDCAECPEMVVLPSGSFRMGSPSGEEGRWDDEGPQRTVNIDYRFAVGRFEVTWAEWEACVRGGGCAQGPVDKAGGDNGWGKGRRPVIEVSWNDSRAYARWLSRKTGEEYRLLSEAEWEYAARGGTTGRFSWGGQDPTCSESARNGANFRSCSDDRTRPVGSFAANPFGLYDVHGNVWEWVQDCYQNSYSGAPIDGSARTQCDGSYRVVRGGSWFYSPQDLRSANRRGYAPVDRVNGVGFRLARTL